MIGYAYNYIWIGYHHHWNGSCCTSNQPLKYIHVWIKHMFFCFFFSGSQPWVVTVFTFTHASGVIPPASNSSIQFYPAVLISTNRNLSTVCWKIMAIGYTPHWGRISISIYIIPMSFFLRVNSNFCSTIKKLWVGSPKPWYPQRPCCQVAMFPPSASRVVCDSWRWAATHGNGAAAAGCVVFFDGSAGTFLST